MGNGEGPASREILAHRAGAGAPALRKRRIEDLLGWAFRHELSKLEWLGLEGRFSFARLRAPNGMPRSTPFFDTLVPIDGGRPPPDDFGPHPDAETIGAAVQALDGRRIAEEIGREPKKLFSDMPDIVQAEAAAALSSYLPRLAKQASNIVVRAARLGRPPAWHGPEGVEIPELRAVAAKNSGAPAWFVMQAVGQETVDGRVVSSPMEVDGFDRVQRRPKPGAYHKYFFDPDPRLIIDERADYRAWRLALDEIFEKIDGRLEEHAALPPKAEAWPWG